MTGNDILTLARAGFNAAQIAAIGSVIAAPAPAPALAAPAAPAPAAPAPAAPAPTPATDQTAEILRQLGVISGQIATNNINSTNQPTPQTADEILAEIIAPPRKE